MKSHFLEYATPLSPRGLCASVNAITRKRVPSTWFSLSLTIDIQLIVDPQTSYTYLCFLCITASEEYIHLLAQDLLGSDLSGAAQRDRYIYQRHPNCREQSTQSE